MVPFTYSAVIGCCLVVCFRTKRYQTFLAAQLFMIFALPFALQYQVGGLMASGAVMVWGFLAPLGSALFQSSRQSIYWFILYVATTIGFLLVDTELSLHAIELPRNLVTSFFAMNVVGVTTVVFVTAHFFVSQLEALNRLLAESFGKFVPQDLVEDLLQSGQAARLGGEQRDVTILFTDIRGYSTIIEHLPPPRVVEMLNRYFSAMETVIEEHDGCILEFIGDAILAVFGAPRDLDDHADRATRCAIEMRATLEELNKKWETTGLAASWHARGLEQLQARVGLHTGEVTAGIFGARNSMKYGVVGDVVNVAARLEAYNKTLGTTILLSVETFEGLAPEVAATAVDQGSVSLKGRERAQRLYSI